MYLANCAKKIFKNERKFFILVEVSFQLKIGVL